MEVLLIPLFRIYFSAVFRFPVFDIASGLDAGAGDRHLIDIVFAGLERDGADFPRIGFATYREIYLTVLRS